MTIAMSPLPILSTKSKIDSRNDRLPSMRRPLKLFFRPSTDTLLDPMAEKFFAEQAFGYIYLSSLILGAVTY